MNWKGASATIMSSITSLFLGFLVFYASELVKKIDLLSIKVGEMNSNIAILLKDVNRHEGQIATMESVLQDRWTKGDHGVYSSKVDQELLRIRERLNKLESSISALSSMKY